MTPQQKSEHLERTEAFKAMMRAAMQIMEIVPGMLLDISRGNTGEEEFAVLVTFNFPSPPEHRKMIKAFDQALDEFNSEIPDEYKLNGDGES